LGLTKSGFGTKRTLEGDRDLRRDARAQPDLWDDIQGTWFLMQTFAPAMTESA
jgi:hypothetical protein